MDNKKTEQFDIIGIGRAYIDIIAPTTYELLEKFDIPLDTGRYFDEASINQIKSHLPNPVYYPGGTIPNTLSGLAALGAKVGYIGKFANDPAGQVFLDDLKSRSITHVNAGFVENGMMSGTCIVLLTDNGERSFALHKGCADQFSDADFENINNNNTRFFIVAANLLSNASTYEVLIRFMQKTANSSCKVVLSTSEVRSWDGREDIAREAIKYTNILIGNEIENDALFKVTGHLNDKNILVVTTRGAAGASAQKGNEEAHVIDAIKEGPVISTLGAGDQFLAGFMQGLILNLSIKECLGIAIRCAHETIQIIEARPQINVSWEHLIKG